MQGQMHSGDMQLVQGSRLIGLEVRNQNQENLGKIGDFAIDVNTGKIRYVVLSVGGVMGMGGKMLPLPWNALTTVSNQSTTEGTMGEV